MLSNAPANMAPDEDPEPAPNPSVEPAAQDKGPDSPEEIGDFITRHVLDKDTVFFEG